MNSSHLNIIAQTIIEVSPYFKGFSEPTMASWLLKNVSSEQINIRKFMDFAPGCPTLPPHMIALENVIVALATKITPHLASHILGEENLTLTPEWFCRQVQHSLKVYYRLSKLMLLSEQALGQEHLEFNGKNLKSELIALLSSRDALYSHTSLYSIQKYKDGVSIDVPILSGMQEDIIRYQRQAARMIASERDRLSNKVGVPVYIRIANIESEAFKSAAENIIAADFNEVSLVVAFQSLNQNESAFEVAHTPVAPLSSAEMSLLELAPKTESTPKNHVSRISGVYSQAAARIETICAEYKEQLSTLVFELESKLPTDTDSLFTFLAQMPNEIVDQVYDRDIIIVSLLQQHADNVDVASLIETQTKELFILLAELSVKENIPFTPIQFEVANFSLKNMEIH